MPSSAPEANEPGNTGRVRREYGGVLLVTVAGAAALLAAGGQVWAAGDVDVSGQLAPAPVRVNGDAAAPTASALGWAGLAAVAALVATRGWARRVVGALLVLFGAVAGYDLWRGTRPGALADAAAARSAVDGRVTGLDPVATWPLLAAAGAVLLLVAGAATLARGAAWPGMGGRYDRHSAPAATGTGDPAELWKSLDSGADPTLDPASEDAVPAPGTTDAPTTDENAQRAETKER